MGHGSKNKTSKNKVTPIPSANVVEKTNQLKTKHSIQEPISLPQIFDERNKLTSENVLSSLAGVVTTLQPLRWMHPTDVEVFINFINILH